MNPRGPETDSKKNQFFTVFFLGSGQNYAKSGMDINWGFYDDCYVGEIIGKEEKIFIGEAKRHGQRGLQLQGTEGVKILLTGPMGTLGKGEYDPRMIQENVDYAVQQIVKWLSQNTPNSDGQYHINFTGFSRGAVTCLRAANALRDYLDNNDILNVYGTRVSPGQISLNIFADDPVAGPNEKHDIDAKKIPFIVKHYTSTLQLDESRLVFTPQDKTRIQVENSKISQVIFLPLFGNHTETNRIFSEETKDLAIIHYNLKCAFLKQFGNKNRPVNENLTENTMPQILYHINFKGERNVQPVLATPTQLLEHYANAKKNREHYKERDISINLPLVKHTRSAGSEFRVDYTPLDDYFMNQHERELFKRVYPKLFNFVFEKGAVDPLDPHNTGGMKALDSSTHGYTRTALQNELNDMQRNNPELYSNFKAQDKNPFNKPELKASGIGIIEKCCFLNMLEGKEIPPKSNVEILAEKIIEELYISMRAKVELHASTSVEKKIRMEINAILIDDQLNDTDKIKNLIDLVENYLTYNLNNSLKANLSNIIKPYKSLLAPQPILAPSTQGKSTTAQLLTTAFSNTSNSHLSSIASFEADDPLEGISHSTLNRVSAGSVTKKSSNAPVSDNAVLPEVVHRKTIRSTKL